MQFLNPNPRLVSTLHLGMSFLEDSPFVDLEGKPQKKAHFLGGSFGD